MARRFRGESIHKVDKKGRVSIPATFRRVIEEGDPDWSAGQNPTFIIVYGRKSKVCLEGYSIKAMDEVEDAIAKLPRYSREREAFERMLSTQSTYATLDENGRIVLAAKYRDLVGIEAEAMFAGMGDKFQIWEPAAYQQDMERIDDWFGSHDEANDPYAQLEAQPAKGE